MLDWQTITAVGALLISSIMMFSRMLDKSLSIREHDEYRKGAESNFRALQAQFERDIDKLESRLTFIDQTKPTTGQLQDATINLKEQLLELKVRVNKEQPK